MSANPSIDEIRQRYHSALRTEDAGSWHQLIQDRAWQMGVTYGGRTVCHVLEPFFMAQAQYELILRRAEHIVAALKKAAFFARSNQDIWSLLGFNADEEELLSIDCGYGHHDQIARLDAFLDEAGEPVFLEYNGESPGGIAYGDSLGQIFDTLEPIQKLARDVPVSRRPVAAEVVRTLRHSYYEWARAKGLAPRTEPQVAIIDLQGIPTIGEFEIFRRTFEGMGMPCRIATPEDIDIRDSQVYCGDFRADIIYRRLLTSDLLQHYGTNHPLVNVMRLNLAFVANGFAGYLLSHKGLFALLSDPELAPKNLSPEQSTAVELAIPWTRFVGEKSTADFEDGAVRPLREIAFNNQDQLVIKQALGYGGKNVCLGWTVSQDTWRHTFESALATPHVIQKRLHIPTTEHPAWVDGELKFLALHFDVDPYILAGRRAHGLGIRLAANDLLNVAAGSGSAIPAYIVSKP